MTLPAGTRVWASSPNGSFNVDIYGYKAVPGGTAPASAAQMLHNAGPTGVKASAAGQH